MAGYGTYATIGDVKGVLGITATTDDTVIRKICESASRLIDNYCSGAQKRYFYCETATKYFDGAVPLRIDDLLTITSIKTDEDGDGTFENTLTVTTDYLLYPLNGYPKTKVELSIGGNYGSFGASKKGCQIVGLWGYGDGISATPYILDTTLTAAISSTTATTCAVTAVTNLSAGNTILIDTEQMYIYSISTLTLTVERGVNGTTAATHNNSTALYIYQYPADIKQACKDLSVAFYQNRGRWGTQSERLGDYSYTMGREMIQGILDDSIYSYRRLRI